MKKVKLCGLDMVCMINFFEFQKTDVSFSINTNNKAKSSRLEKTMSLIQIRDRTS